MEKEIKSEYEILEEKLRKNSRKEFLELKLKWKQFMTLFLNL